MLDLLAPKASEKGLELACLFEDKTPPTMVGDVTRLRQILVNLVGNAVKFTGSGEVVVRVNSMKQPNGRFQLHFVVQDTGIGIPQERMDRLFKSFSQVDPSTTRKYGGTGLGLAISKKLANLMGGEMWVESTVGQGSAFNFTILAEQGKAQVFKPIKRTFDSDIGTKRPLRILLAEDNLINQKVAIHMLKRIKYRTDVVSNGYEVIEALKRQLYDVIFMDIQMPEMDGVEATQIIRQTLSNEEQPYIIALTANALNGEREKYLAQGMDDYISKPIKIQEIVSALKKVPQRDQKLLSAT